MDVSVLQEHQIQYPLRGVFAGLHIFGQIVAENLAAGGITNLVNLAKAYREGWGGLSQGMVSASNRHPHSYQLLTLLLTGRL